MLSVADLLFASHGAASLNPQDGSVVILRGDLVKIIRKLASMDLLRDEHHESCSLTGQAVYVVSCGPVVCQPWRGFLESPGWFSRNPPRRPGEDNP